MCGRLMCDRYLSIGVCIVTRQNWAPISFFLFCMRKIFQKDPHTVSPILRGTRKQTLDPSNEASFQYFDGLFMQDTNNYYSAFKKMQHFENRTIFGWVIAILSCWVWEKQICRILPMEKKSHRFLAIFLPIFRKLAISQPNSIRFPKTRIHLKAGY